MRSTAFIFETDALSSQAMSVREIESAIHQLLPAELDELRVWFEDFVEDQLQLTDEVKAKLDESRADIAEGRYTTRSPG